MANYREMQKQELRKFALDLKSKGYEILVSTEYLNTEQIPYIHVGQPNGMTSIYIQPEDPGSGFNYSSNHQPSKEHGTGYRLKSGEILSDTLVKWCLKSLVPDWISSREEATIKPRSLKQIKEANGNFYTYL